MFEELLGKKVKIHFGIVSGITDTIKGQVVQVENLWLKLLIKE
jgi:hypothetical protein